MQNTEYLSKFSHELRNPLTLINSSLQLLEKECPAVCESALWPQIRRDMSDVIRLLKDMSSSLKSPEKAPVVISDLLSEISASFAPSMELKEIRFDTEVSAELTGACIGADRQKLRQALTNLLLNAADAVTERKKSDPALSGSVTLSAAREGSDLCIHVRDNGPGILPERLSTLFDPYVTYKPNGTGLGLGIVRSIAAQHGGTVTVDTRTAPDAFTDFCLRLPLA